jgi:O-methyltransferase involved in polyketide biosynthesis
MADRQQAELGDVQMTLFVPLAARARQTRLKRPALRDPKAVEMIESIDFDESLYGRGWGGFVTVLRTLIFDWWVRQFLAAHPDGTVVELGAGLNSRFERTDNGTAHYVELDLPDTIELRRRFFADTDRRRMVAGSVLDEDWMDLVAAEPGPYFFVADGVLIYLPEDGVTQTVSRIAERFAAGPGGRTSVAFDTYTKAMLERQHKIAARRGMAARWAWGCDDPREFERTGLRLTESATITRLPRGLRPELPARYRYLLPLANPLLGTVVTLSLFQAG